MPTTLYDEDYRAFVRHLIELRRRAGITQAELAAKLGKPQSYVSKSERFERRVDVAEFRLISIALGEDPVDQFAKTAASLKR